MKNECLRNSDSDVDDEDNCFVQVLYLVEGMVSVCS